MDGGYLSAGKIVNVDISSFAAQDVKLVFRHFNCTDIFYIGIDDVMITQNVLAVANSQKAKISVYPNPATDFVQISNAGTLNKVRIFDLNGRLITETTSTKIDVKQLRTGQYILNIHSGNQIISRKFIKK